jgi:hypothetical protein
MSERHIVRSQEPAPPNLYMDFPAGAITKLITKDRLQLYIRPHCLTAAAGHFGNRSFAPHSFIGPDCCRQVSLGPQTSV